MKKLVKNSHTKDIPKSYRKMCEIYKIFARHYSNLDFSDKAMKEMYESETFGSTKIKIDNFNTSINGFAIGKKWLNVTIAMWFDTIEKYGWYHTIKELFSDELFKDCHWWLNSIFNKFIIKKEEFYKGLDINFSPMKLYKEIINNV